MVSKKQTQIIGIAVILLVALVLTGVLTIPSLSLISPPMTTTLSNGQVFYHEVVTIDKTTSTTATFYASPYTLPNGTKVIPTKNITITLIPSAQVCSYRLENHPEPTIAGINLNLWNYYFPANPSLSATIQVSSSAGGTATLNGTLVGNQVVIQDPDGKGTITLTTQGGFGTSVNCPSPSGIYVLNNNGIPKPVISDQYTQSVNTGINNCAASCILFGSIGCTSCLYNHFTSTIQGSGLPIATNFNGEFQLLQFGDPYGTAIKTMMNGQAQPGRFQNPVVEITADADYVNALYYDVPKTTTPEIKSLSCIQAPESSQSSVLAIVKNTGNTADNYNYQISTTLGSLTPSQGPLTVSAGGESMQAFIWSTPSVSADSPYTMTLKVCSSGEFGGSVCDIETCTNTIKDIPTPVIPPINPEPTPNKCGNEICEANIGETYLTCPTDCQVPVPVVDCSATPNSHLTSGECVCNDGFARSFDAQTGKMACNKPAETDWMAYAVYGLLGVAVLALGYALFGRKGGKKK